MYQQKTIRNRHFAIEHATVTSRPEIASVHRTALSYHKVTLITEHVFLVPCMTCIFTRPVLHDARTSHLTRATT
jgi:hypothetical protein